MMAMRPELLEMAGLPPLPEPLVAIGGIDPHKEASAALGKQGVAVMVRTLAAAVQRILDEDAGG